MEGLLTKCGARRASGLTLSRQHQWGVVFVLCVIGSLHAGLRSLRPSGLS
jgi:hypothetical protein